VGLRRLFRVSRFFYSRDADLSADFSDGVSGRVLTTEIDNDKLTMEICVADCNAQNFTIAGGEFSVRNRLSLLWE
jgi:hypothetical protein